MGMTGISKSQVSRLCEEIDGPVGSADIPPGDRAKPDGEGVSRPADRLRGLLAASTLWIGSFVY
jgi:hypothetical protein